MTQLELEVAKGKEVRFFHRTVEHIKSLNDDPAKDTPEWQDRVDWMWDVHDESKRRINALKEALRAMNNHSLRGETETNTAARTAEIK